jgi:predicted O-methyltransferase YrrM
MKDTLTHDFPPYYGALLEKSEQMGFAMAADPQAGSLLRTLVASKPRGRFLELGTGMGLSLSWMVDGMDDTSVVISLDNDAVLVAIVQECFKTNKNVHIHCVDGGEWINSYKGPKFDVIFADTWPSKYSHLEATLHLVKDGGFYVVDDMMEQPNWPQGHDQKAGDLRAYFLAHKDFYVTEIAWSTGMMLGAKRR